MCYIYLLIYPTNQFPRFNCYKVISYFNNNNIVIHVASGTFFTAVPFLLRRVYRT